MLDEALLFRVALEDMPLRASGAGREDFSCVGRVGMCDKYFSNHLPCNLAQEGFPAMGMPGWGGLRTQERSEKAAPCDSRGPAERRLLSPQAAAGGGGIWATACAPG